MMDLGKVKDALIASRNQIENDIISIDNDADIFEMVQQNEMPEAWDMVVAALAELEKPAEDDVLQLASRWVVSSIDTESLAYDIHQYAESYHAKKCAECWRVPRVMCSICGDPIIVGGVCENCVPDMFNGDRHFHSSDVGEFRKNLNSDIDEIIKNEPEAPNA